jgi:predicted acylesterase/phospholipase RssA
LYATLTCLCEQHYDLKQVDFVGASAGALAATLAATGVDANESLDLALKLSEENGVFERGGLKGVWGGLVQQWLDELLPDDAHDVCRDRVHLLSLQLTLPRPRRRLISDFESKEDLIGACMSSGGCCCTFKHNAACQAAAFVLICMSGSNLSYVLV